MNFHETNMEDGSWPELEPINFWCGSGTEQIEPGFSSHVLELWESTFDLTVSFISQGEMLK